MRVHESDYLKGIQFYVNFNDLERVSDSVESCVLFLFEPVHEKTNNLGFRPGLTQTRLYSHSIKLEA